MNNTNEIIINKETYLFNSSLEVALRIMVLLNNKTTDTFDLERLVIFDYFILHGNDLDDRQESLHPALPNRSTEIIIRRKIVQEGLNILLSRGLISQLYKNEGIYYSSNQNTHLFVKLLSSKYYSKLSSTIEWVHSKYGNVSTFRLNNMVNNNLHSWGGEFEYEAFVRSNYEQ